MGALKLAVFNAKPDEKQPVGGRPFGRPHPKAVRRAHCHSGTAGWQNVGNFWARPSHVGQFLHLQDHFPCSNCAFRALIFV